MTTVPVISVRSRTETAWLETFFPKLALACWSHVDLWSFSEREPCRNQELSESRKRKRNHMKFNFLLQVHSSTALYASIDRKRFNHKELSSKMAAGKNRWHQRRLTTEWATDEIFGTWQSSGQRLRIIHRSLFVATRFHVRFGCVAQTIGMDYFQATRKWCVYTSIGPQRQEDKLRSTNKHNSIISL